MARQTIEGHHPEHVALESARSSGDRIAAIVSAIALVFSAYSLWETSLKRLDVRVFVPPVIQYSAPYQNSNFEMLSVPVTLTNEGARTATVLSMELTVSDPRSNEVKHFYAADIGRWSMERTRAQAYPQFRAALARRTIEPHGADPVLHARRRRKAGAAYPRGRGL